MMLVKEDFQNEPSVAVIGDQIAYLLDNSDLLRPFELIDPDMTIDMLTEKLVVHEPYESIGQVFFSIGTNDMFEPDSSITTLIDEMFRVFPNAELYLMKGYIDIDEKKGRRVWGSSYGSNSIPKWAYNEINAHLHK